MRLLIATVMAAAVLAGPVASAQEEGANNMAILLEKVRADKKLLVATNMDLTEQEATAFWPLYESYQKEFADLNGRLKGVIERYAEAYNQGDGTVSDDLARGLLDDVLDIEAAELDLKKSYRPKFEKALPAAKVARYYQIENKIRSALKADLAAGIPLVQ
jgi:hypothetical protein